MKPLTSRERVLRTIEHQETDRMPLDLGVHFSTGISAFAYWNLREYLGLSTNRIELIDCVQGLARVDDDVLERFHIDTVLLNPPWPSSHCWNPMDKYRFWVPETFEPEQTADGGWKVSFQGESMYMPKGGFFFDGAWPNFYGLSPEAELELYAQRAEALYKETDKFTILMGFSGFFDGIDFACDMLIEPEEVCQRNEARLKAQIERFEQVNKRYGAFIGAIEINSDLGMQKAPMCSPESYEECCYSYLKRFCDHVHKTSGIKVFIHSCGSIYQLMPYIVEAGVDCINPVQISAAEMEPARLKKEFGQKICFWGGGCDTQNILWKKSAPEVAAHTREMVSILKPGGGFVFNQVHNIMGNVPPENIVAMLDAAYESSFYTKE